MFLEKNWKTVYEKKNQNYNSSLYTNCYKPACIFSNATGKLRSFDLQINHFSICKAKWSNHYSNYHANLLKFFQKNPGDHRRKWDKDEYERLAQERLEEEQRKQLEKELREPHQKRELLKPREYKVGGFTEMYKNSATQQEDTCTSRLPWSALYC